MLWILGPQQASKLCSDFACRAFPCGSNVYAKFVWSVFARVTLTKCVFQHPVIQLTRLDEWSFFGAQTPGVSGNALDTSFDILSTQDSNSEIGGRAPSVKDPDRLC